jgi:hypothetical protein
MRMRTTLTFAARSIAARPGRSLALTGGVALCIALYVALSTMSDAYVRLVRKPLETLAADVTVQRPGAPKAAGVSGRITTPPANAPLTADEVAKASATARIAQASAALILWDRSPRGFTVIMGIDPLPPAATVAPRTPDAPAEVRQRTGPSVVQEWVSAGRPLREDGDLLLEEHFAKLNRLKVGDRFNLGGLEMPITGLVKMREGGSLIPANAFVTLDQARAIAGLPQGGANVVFARVEKGADLGVLRSELASRLPGAVMTASDSIGEMMRGFGVISGHFATIVGAVALAFAAIACHRLISGSVHERRAEFGVMKAVGWQRKDMASVLTAESAALGLAGGVAGLLLGYLISVLAGDSLLASQTPMQMGALPAGVSPMAGEGVAARLPVALSWLTCLVGLGVSFVVAGAAGWLVSAKIAKACVMDALRQP